MRNDGRLTVVIIFLLLGIFSWYLPLRLIGWVQADTAQTYEMYFAQLADGGGYATQFLLVNPGGTDIVCTLDLFRSNGTPLPLALNGATDSSFTLNIKARGTLSLKSANQGDQTQIGWARVRSASPIGGSLIYSYSVGGTVLGEAGLDPSVPAENFRLSVDMQNDYLAGLAVANPNAMPVSLSLTLYDSGGNSLAWSNRNLGALEHFAQLPAEIFPSYNFYNFTGSIAVRAPENVLIGTTLRFDAGVNVLASIPVIDTTTNPEPEILNFPQIADGAGYSTTFCLVNPNDRAIAAQLNFYRQDGTPLAMALYGRPAAGSHSIALPAFGTAFLHTLNTNPGQPEVGWARVSADGPIGGSVVYYFHSGGRVLSQAGINPAVAVSEFVLAVDRTGGMLSGLAVANPNVGGSVTLRMTLLDQEGRQRGTTATWTLQGRRQFALMLDQLFPMVNLTDFIGSLVVKTDGGKVAGTTLRFKGDLSVFSSIPVVSGIAIAEVPTTITTTSTTTSTSTSTSSTLPPMTLSGSLDSPKSGATVSGVGSGSGWAVLIAGKTGLLPAKIELLVDGAAAAVARQGIARPDVKSYFSGLGITIPTDTGYTFSWASFVYPAGAHTLTIQATSSGGQKYELTRVTVHMPAGNNNLHSNDTIVGNLRAIPAGTFLQGSPETEPGRAFQGEGPQFLHTFTKSLLVTETEISRKMWSDLRVVQSTLPPDPSSSISSSPAYPVTKVSWYDTLLFANLLSLHHRLTVVYYKDSGFTQPLTASNYKTGEVYCNFNANGFRLPTEGEWEYFTRAGTTGPFWLSEPAYTSATYESCTAGVFTALETVSWFCPNGQKTAHGVGLKASNPWGLKDVYGNVWEWCWDWQASYPSGAQTDYHGPATGQYRCMRGGSFAVLPFDIRSANRGGFSPEKNTAINIGFRLVRSLH